MVNFEEVVVSWISLLSASLMQSSLFDRTVEDCQFFYSDISVISGRYFYLLLFLRKVWVTEGNENYFKEIFSYTVNNN